MEKPKMMMLYFSGTGNTKLIVNKLTGTAAIKENFEISTIAVEKAAVEKIDVKIFDILAVSFPVYDYQAPDLMLEFIRSLPVSKEPKALIVFSTFGIDGRDANDRLAFLLKTKNYFLIANEGFKAPAPSLSLYTKTIGLAGSGGFFRIRPLEKIMSSLFAFEKNIDGKIGTFAQTVVTQFGNFKTMVFSLPLKLKPMQKFWKNFSRMTFGFKFYRKMVISENCTNCGLCSVICPSGSLHVEDGKMKIMEKNSCQRCLRCIQNCKSRAIDFTSSKRFGDYTHKTVEVLYDRACVHPVTIH